MKSEKSKKEAEDQVYLKQFRFDGKTVKAIKDIAKYLEELTGLTHSQADGVRYAVHYTIKFLHK